jgi:hypothetical protein
LPELALNLDPPDLNLPMTGVSHRYPASNLVLGFCESVNKTPENIKQNIVAILSKYKLEFAHLCSSSSRAKIYIVIFFILSINFVPKKIKRCLLVKYTVCLIYNFARVM